MPTYGACRSALVAAPPQAVFDALTAFEDLPRWQSAVRSVAVLDRDAQGRGRTVEYVVDAKVRTVRYRIEHVYDEPSRIDARYVEGDFAAMEGAWRLDPRGGGGTCATFDLAIDPGRAVPRAIRRLVSTVVVRGALTDLQRHLAAGTVAAPPGG